MHKQLCSFQEEFFYSPDGDDIFIRVIYSARKSTFSKKINREQNMETIINKKEKIIESSRIEENLQIQNENLQERRLRRLNKIPNVQKFALWKNYFHGNPLVLERIKKHYVDDGKKICIQYCCKHDHRLEKANHCTKQCSLL